jgi:hypothetical protein
MKSTLKPNCLKSHVKGKVLAENRMKLNTDIETNWEVKWKYQPTSKHINKQFQHHKTNNYKMPKCANFKFCQIIEVCASTFKLL